LAQENASATVIGSPLSTSSPVAVPFHAMPGAVGAIIGARRARENRTYVPTPISKADLKRREAQLEEYRQRVILNSIFKRYDKNKSNKLERPQIIQLLTDIDSSTPQGTPPTDEEVDWIIKAVDREGDQCIDIGELQEAIVCWRTYTEKRDELEATLAKYDVSKTGKLSKDEVKSYLVDLNGGMEVTDVELEMVIKEADVLGDGSIDKMDLQRATAQWYAYVEKEKNGCCCLL